MRIGFIKSLCEHCRKILMPVVEINSKLPVGKRIRMINLDDWENFGMKLNPIQNHLPFDGYPTLFLNSIKINNILSKDQLRSFLDGYFEREKIVE